MSVVREQWHRLVVEASGTTYWHLTDKANFKLNPKFVPADNAIAIRQRTAPGLYLAKDLEPWINGHGYIRPYAAEISVPESALVDERWGGEKFLPAEHFDQARILRVIPIDAYAREVYNAAGWIEDRMGTTFDTDEPFTEPTWKPIYKDYRYSGPDAREMSKEDQARHKQRWRKVLRSWNS